MATTITIKESTKARLDDYKMGRTTYDDLLNSFMDEIDLEDVTKNHLEEHYRRLADFRPITMDELIKHLKEKKKL